MQITTDILKNININLKTIIVHCLMIIQLLFYVLIKDVLAFRKRHHNNVFSQL